MLHAYHADLAPCRSTIQWILRNKLDEATDFSRGAFHVRRCVRFPSVRVPSDPPATISLDRINIGGPRMRRRHPHMSNILPHRLMAEMLLCKGYAGRDLAILQSTVRTEHEIAQGMKGVELWWEAID